MFDENWTQYLGGGGNRKFTGILLGFVTAAVIEQDGGKGTRSDGLPQVSFET